MKYKTPLTNTVIVLLSVKISDLLFYSDITKEPVFINSFISFNKYTYSALVNTLNAKETVFTQNLVVKTDINQMIRNIIYNFKAMNNNWC